MKRTHRSLLYSRHQRSYIGRGSLPLSYKMTLRSLMLFLAHVALATALNCLNITIPIFISARNGVFDLEPPRTENGVTGLFLGLSRPEHNATAQYLKDVGALCSSLFFSTPPSRSLCLLCAQGEQLASDAFSFVIQYKTVTGDYKLAATYCEAQEPSAPDALQILTHGVGFDRSYWDYPYNDFNYSYVRDAVEHGYSTLTWDRLGVGESSHGDPVNEIQIFLEIAALKALTELARAGNLPKVSRRFSKISHVGHSFGSAMTYGLTALYPNISDAIVLTGFSQVPQYMAYFALGGNFVPVNESKSLADKYAPGYVAPKSSVGVHINFFGPDNFDSGLLESAYRNGQPAAVGELLTVGSVPKTSNFAGRVMIITGGT